MCHSLLSCSLDACMSAPLSDGTPRDPDHRVLASQHRAGPPASGEHAIPRPGKTGGLERGEGWRESRGWGGEDRKVLGHSQVGLAGQTGCTGVTVTITAENMSECLQGEEEGRIASLHLGRLGS